jgi:hypothetical protein
MRRILPPAASRKSGAGVKDRAAADLASIELILRTVLSHALDQVLEQIERVLREEYPEVPEIRRDDE